MLSSNILRRSQTWYLYNLSTRIGDQILFSLLKKKKKPRTAQSRNKCIYFSRETSSSISLFILHACDREVRGVDLEARKKKKAFSNQAIHTWNNFNLCICCVSRRGSSNFSLTEATIYETPCPHPRPSIVSPLTSVSLKGTASIVPDPFTRRTMRLCRKVHLFEYHRTPSSAPEMVIRVEEDLSSSSSSSTAFGKICKINIKDTFPFFHLLGFFNLTVWV